MKHIGLQLVESTEPVKDTQNKPTNIRNRKINSFFEQESTKVNFNNMLDKQTIYIIVYKFSGKLCNREMKSSDPR